MLELSSMPVGYLAIAAAMTTLAALVQGTIGLGFAIVSVPMLALLDPRLTPVPQLLVTLPLSLWMLHRERHSVDVGGVVWTTLGRIPGTAVGTLLVGVASQRVLDLATGAFVLLGVGLLSRGKGFRRTRVTELLAGLASGVGAVVSAIGGPPLALLYKDDEGPTIRSSLALIFTLGGVVTLAGRGLAGQVTRLDLELGLFLLPAMFVGVYLSRYLTQRVEGQPMRLGILTISAIAATALVGRAALG